MDNGILQIAISKPAGMVTRVSYNGNDNLLEVRNDETNRGYLNGYCYYEFAI